MVLFFLEQARAEEDACSGRETGGPAPLCLCTTVLQKRDQTVRGLLVHVNSYTERDRSLLEAAVQETQRLAGGEAAGKTQAAGGRRYRAAESVGKNRNWSAGVSPRECPQQPAP